MVQPSKWSFNTLLAVLGVAAAIALTSPGLIIVLLISIIGLPIAIFLMAAPGLFLVLLLARLFQKSLGGGRSKFFIGIGVALGLLAIIPWWVNAGLEKKANALVLEDRDGLPQWLTANVLAIRSTGYQHGSKDMAKCDDLCLRTLLNQQASAVIVAHSMEALAPIDFSEKALSYKLEKRSHCPEINLQAGYGTITVDGEEHKPGAKNATELMRFEIAKGNCLIERTAQLADADIVVSMGSIARGKDAFAAGLDLAADTVRADRIQVYVKQTNQFKEAYRWTGVQTAKFFPILVPTVISGYGLEMRAGFLRLTDQKNIDSKFYHGPDRSAFFTKKLGLDLALRPDDAEMETRKLVIAALDGAGQIDSSRLNLIEDYFQGLQQVKVIGNENTTLVIRALADKRVLIPRSLWAVVRNAKGQPAKYFAELAGIFFARLHEADLFPDGKFDYDLAERLGRLGVAIEMLPEHAILAHRDDLEWLARQDFLRVPAYRALKQLSVFGADAAPTLLFLIDDGKRFDEANKKSAFHDRNGWQHPYLAGLGGLCQMGPPGASMIGPLLERLDTGVVIKHSSYWRLIIHTLVGMGADPEEIWKHVQTDDQNHTKDRFDGEVVRARNRKECDY